MSDFLFVYLLFGFIYLYFALMLGGMLVSGSTYRNASEDERAFRTTIFFLNMSLGTLVWPLATIILACYGIYKICSPAKWALSGSMRYIRSKCLKNEG